jgi:hypothetical protein
MENKALKQRLESLAQEQLIKYCKFLLFHHFSASFVAMILISVLMA